MTGIAFEQELNEEQLRAVQAPDGPVLVIAAAGTGKTRTLTYRVAWLVERGIPPSRVLLLTFTNKAAREMLERAHELVGEAVGGLWGGTFHHMANRMLRMHADLIGYGRDYSILDEDDAKRLVKLTIDDLGLPAKLFPKPEVLLSLYGLASSRADSIESMAADRFVNAPFIRPEDVVKVHRIYGERKRALNAMDFDDLLANGLKLFQERPEIQERYSERFRYVMVDEYQDTNTIQAEWVDALARQHRNLMVVGDDFQSIYSWRGADFRNIMQFPNRYRDAVIFKLETNYRSVPEILDVANACIAGNPEQFQKTLKAVRPSARKPVVGQLQDGDHQATFIIEQIRRHLALGVPAREIAVLYRSHFHAMELQIQLARHRIPYLITSGVRFFEQAHIKDVCCLIRLVGNPMDELAFGRMLELMPKLGPKTVSKLWDKLGRRFDPRSARDRDELIKVLPGAAREIWQPVHDRLRPLFDERPVVHPSEIITAFVESFYQSHAVTLFDNAERRMEDVDELIRFTTRYETVAEFLSEVALQSNLDNEPAGEDQSGEVIRLSTIHQAKGLEWRVVFILWAMEGLFPSQKTIMENGDLSEERRLFYVATTRARDELTMCCPRYRRNRDGGVQAFMPSRFISELPADLVQAVRPGRGLY
ncbi:MAG TPA: ATP-dependent helicase [Kiritimatiellia bacterium]|nr:ATP-dependent helicase [Kiritimatiellia bacterium]HMO98069.1 ATP-dependent helicase [Kiritimatiellia bacterium]HMP97713.1 ATP-dependent helicase [Kiritimatiellia bacterium]